MAKPVLQGNKIKHLTKNPALKLLLDNFNRDVVKFSRLCMPKTILDIGCGEGFTTVDIAKSLPQSKIKAIDIVKERVDYAKANNSLPNIVYSKADLFKLKGSYDLVICNEVLEHLSNYQEAIEVLLSLSKRFIIVSVPNEPWFRLASLLSMKYLNNGGRHPDHVNMWSSAQFRRILSRYGKVRRFRSSGVWSIVLLEK